jgi:ABC-type transport system involved in multi-copper enzyme maturation permease subunit
MSISRIWCLAWSDIRLAWRKPLFIVMFVLLSLMALGLVLGGVQIRAGSADTSGPKLWINSEFNLAFADIILFALFLPFFTSVACGMTLLNDEDRKLDRVLHSTPLSFLEYVIARFLGAAVPIAVVMLAFGILQMGLYELWPVQNASQVRGPFDLVHYLRPLGIFGGSLLIFSGGVAMLLGTLSRQPVLVFAFPTVLLVGGIFFIWDFNPEWLSPVIDRTMQFLDPGSVRWIIQNFTKESRGVEFYNHASMMTDPTFVASRLGLAVIGSACVLIAAPVTRRRIRGVSPRVALDSIPRPAQPSVIAEVAGSAPAPESSQQVPGFITTTLAVLRAELYFLVRSPGIWLFAPLIVLQVYGQSSLRTGPLDTFVLQTSGSLAASTFNTLTLLLALLILYYTVESLVREERRGLSKIVNSTSAPTAAILSGKVLANAVLSGVVIAGSFLGALAVLVQQRFSDGIWVGLEPGVFLLIWVVLLAPTLIFWSAFVTFVFALLRNRYATYGVALAALAATGFATLRGWTNWATLWHLWSAVNWSDLDRLGFARTQLVANRVLVLTIAVFLIVAALRVWPRRSADVRGVFDRLAPGRLLRLAAVPLMILAPGAALMVWMLVAMRAGSEGGPMERLAKDYWRQNEATWRDTPSPALDSVKADIDLRPESRSFTVRGEYVLRNASPKAVEAVAISLRPHLIANSWTVDGQTIKVSKTGEPRVNPSIENRSGLLVIRPAMPLAPQAKVTVGFEMTAEFPKGWTKRGTGGSEFVLPSGIVLTSFTGSFLPLPGYSEGAGIDEDNRSDSKEFADDHWKETVDPLFGPAWATDVQLTVTGPESWTINSVGVPGEPRIADGRKTITWTSDHPVRFFNLVGGPLEAAKGKAVTIYHSPRHSYRVAQMVEMLDAARQYYSEWFYPYPWRDFKLTEFPALATYAQGFPGNISFSEAIGFLTRKPEDGEADLGDFVVAHESAHQWWGNILTPGKGPGGNVLSEGMANYSAIMLVTQIRGEDARHSLMRRFENQYADSRNVDNERPLHKVDGSRPGDTTVTYDRGGWVFWMLMQEMGRERMLAGLKEFIEQFKDGPDFPLVEDFLATLRKHAPDEAKFDAFTRQWVLSSSLPEFVFEDIKKNHEADGTWTVSGRVKNIGTGTVAVDMAALGAEPAKGAAKAEGAAVQKAQRAIQRVDLVAGGEAKLSIRCDFDPVKAVADPDVLLLQRGRKRATSSIP